MYRLELVRYELDKFLLEDSNPENSRDGYVHLYGVSQYCTLLAMRRGLDIELCAIAGLLHDIYTYKYEYVKDHADKGAAIAEKLLQDLKIITEPEISKIVEAIACHSDKNVVNNDLCEVLKDADTLQNSLYNPKIIIKHKKRLKSILKEFGVKSKLKDILFYSDADVTSEKDE